MAFRPGTLFEGSGMGNLVKRTQANLNKQSVFSQSDPFRRQAKEAGGAAASPVTINLGGGQARTASFPLNIPPITTPPPPALDPNPPSGGPPEDLPTIPAGDDRPFIPVQQLEATIGDMPQVVQELLRPLLDKFNAGEITYGPISELLAALGTPNPTATGAAAREMSGAFRQNPFISRLGRGRMFLGNAPLFSQFRQGFLSGTDETFSNEMLGLLQSLGVPLGALQQHLERTRPASFR
ncbi:hypothetical protein LCGC14_1447280 [marine sediment metagenome]|uniref:Uncharacterized protein n=1 Tax=marine sediment metagenome TaxID=412755 RepID=A0A0F9LZE0_9ZZZZ